MKKLLTAPDPVPAVRRDGAIGRAGPDPARRRRAPAADTDRLRGRAPRPDPPPRRAGRRGCGATACACRRRNAIGWRPCAWKWPPPRRPAHSPMPMAQTPARDIVLLRAALFETPPDPAAEAEIAKGATANLPGETRRPDARPARPCLGRDAQGARSPLDRLGLHPHPRRASLRPD